MANIKLLDCTLRDGGYLNNWEFGQDCISDIIKSLEQSNIDIIECGFLTNTSTLLDQSLFSSISDIEQFISGQSKYALMLNYGTVGAEDIRFNQSFDFELRIAFKKHSLDEIEQFCQNLDKNGIKYSLNPMHTSLYSQSELNTLINITNRLNPTCMTVVDTMGVMRDSDTVELFETLNSKISKNIPLGFHSHDNLDLSFLNIKKLLDMRMDRDIIIDAALLGIGRGGGMPKTEDVARLLNSNYGGRFKVATFDALSDKYTSKLAIIDKEYKYMYKLSAENYCHPNYALYLIHHDITSINIVNRLLALIPTEYKMIYTPKIVENIVNNSLTNVTV